MFAIQFVSNGVTKYIRSRNYSDLEESIERCHQFNNEAAATRCLKRLRLDGHEENGLFSIVKLKLIPELEIQVPHPKPKSGFVLTRVVQGKKKYYMGAKQLNKLPSDSVVVDAFGTIFRATTFKTEAHALQKIADMVAFCNDRIDHYTAKKNKGSSYGYTVRESDRYIKLYTDRLAIAKDCVVEHI